MAKREGRVEGEIEIGRIERKIKNKKKIRLRPLHAIQNILTCRFPRELLTNQR
jgi:hypothetical protein